MAGRVDGLDKTLNQLPLKDNGQRSGCISMGALPSPKTTKEEEKK